MKATTVILKKIPFMPDQLITAIGKYIMLSADDRRRIPMFFQKHIIQKNEHWLKEGERCRHLAFIEKGLLRFYMNEDGREITHFFASEGDFACNYESLLKQTPSRKNIEAVETSTLWTISETNLQLFYRDIEQGERFGRLLTEKELLETIQRFLEQYTQTPEQRYQDFLTKYSLLQQRIPQYYIASYIGVQPQSLSRIRKRMSSAEQAHPDS